jgi:hypothetical protein
MIIRPVTLRLLVRTRPVRRIVRLHGGRCEDGDLVGEQLPVAVKITGEA